MLVTEELPMSKSVVGLFDSFEDAELAKHTLLSRGFPGNDIAISAHALATTATPDDGVPARETPMQRTENFFSDVFGASGSEHAGHYTEAIRRGGAVVTVTVADDANVDTVRSALASGGAIDIDERVAAWRGTGYAGYQKGSAPFTAAQVEEERSHVIPEIQEALQLDKRQVDLGTVRVVSHVVQTPVTQAVSLREEHAHIERRPVDRPATPADLANHQGQTIEVRETAEKAVVAKTAHVVEEVIVGKAQTSHTEEIADTLRHTEIDVGQTGQIGALGNYDNDFREDFQLRYEGQGEAYDAYAPAYQYGAALANDARYQDRSWTDIEASARQEWQAAYPNRTWDRAMAAVRYGWERAVGQR
jgi:uncharacterized protein (TIGR02271 family)